MKKITALLLVVLMLAAMSVAVFARYEVCSKCGGRLKEYTTTKTVGSVTCSKSGDSTMRDKVKQDYYVIKCTSCGDTDESADGDTYVVCTH